MLNLLVVDDEPMLADGVSSLLQTNFPDDLTVYTALSGEKAFAILEQIKIDLLLTDINMPDVDGLELQRRACERWPHLTVIFLTGHSEFHYMQTAIQQNAYHYILKSEGDDKLLSAVSSAIGQTYEKQKDLLSALSREDRLERVNEAYASDTVEMLLTDETMNVEKLAHRLDIIGNGMEAQGYFYAAMLFLTEDMQEENRRLAKQLAVSLLRDQLRVLSCQDTESRVTLLMQSAGNADASAVGGRLEYMQRMMTDQLNERVTVVWSPTLVTARQICPLCWEMADYVVRTCPDAGEILRYAFSGHSSADDIRQHGLAKPLQTLVSELIEGHWDHFCLTMHDLLWAKDVRQSMSSYRMIYALLSNSAQTIPESGSAQAFFADHRFDSIRSHASIADAEEYLRQAARAVFDSRLNQGDVRRQAVVARIHRYIEDHVDEDISLTQLSELVDLNSAYLSRMYREATGQVLRDTIMAVKISKERELLCDPCIRIQDVARAVGMGSAGYFSKFFKRNVGMSPQEYREKYCGV